jgi:hypothetical protein
MNYEEALKKTAVYFKVWEKIFSFQKIDFFIHEPTSLMMNHMAAIYCKKQGGVYSTHIAIQGELSYNFVMLDFDNGYPSELIYIYNNLTNDDVLKEKERILSFIEKFRSSYDVFFNTINSSKPKFGFYLNIIKSAIKEQLIKLLKRPKFDHATDNIEIFLTNLKFNSNRLKNFINYRKIKYDKCDANDEYYFYPLHLEPEAVVLYWADGIYSNQVKLIENIAAQLPIGISLYVKDHPHLYGYRDVIDYQRLQQIPNVKLLPPYLPGKKIIKDSKGVVTISGTAGFEALLMNKHVITFGSPFYRVFNRVFDVRNIRDLREVFYSLRDVQYEDDAELYKFVLAYLKSQKNGFTDFYLNYAEKANIEENDNSIQVADGLTSFFNNYPNFQETAKPKGTN